jgi:methyl-accepting chemotaxis protein
MSDLQSGRFDNSVENTLHGEFYKIIEAEQSTKDTLSRVFQEIIYVIEQASLGDFSNRVEHNSEGSIKVLTEKLNASMVNLSDNFDDIVRVSQSMAAGDFTKKIERDCAYKMDEAKQSINQAVDDIGSLIRTVKLSSSDVQSIIEMVAVGTESLSDRTQEQASALEQTSAAMEQTNAQIVQNLSLTNEASKSTHAQVDFLTSANNAMESTKSSMSGIKESSVEIQQIVSLIDSIAFQTNLLALNAAVEAARAGEHGRGFAVVAGEVRALAQKSADAAKEIGSLIDETSVRVDQGVLDVDKVNLSLHRIDESTESLVGIIDSINTSSNEQAIGVSEVNKAISSIDSATQENSSLVEKNYASTEEMLKISKELSDSISKFKL